MTNGKHHWCDWMDMDSVWSNLTPRYLTDSCILISEFKIVMELPATCFTREAVPTIITSVLSVFSINLLLSIQHKMSLIHFWIVILVNSNFSGGPLWNTMVSSAYLWKEQLCRLMTSERDWEYNVNKTGPNTEPWGTPYKSGRGFEVDPLTMTDWNRWETYEQNHLRTLPLIPKVISRRLRRIEWSSVSNAALRSRRATSETNFSSEFVSKLSMTLSTAVSTLWPFL